MTEKSTITPGVRSYHFPPLHNNNQTIADYASAQQQLDAGYESGRQQGYNEGLAQGREDGLREGKQDGLEQGLLQGRLQGEKLGRQQYEQVLPTLSAMTTQLNNMYKHQVREQKEQLLQLIRQVTEHILPAELALNPLQIKILLEDSYKALPDPVQGVKIYLNPSDKKRLLSIGFHMQPEWPILDDNKLAVGDCRIESTTSVIEASISKQLANNLAKISSQLDEPSHD